MSDKRHLGIPVTAQDDKGNQVKGFLAANGAGKYASVFTEWEVFTPVAKSSILLNLSMDELVDLLEKKEKHLTYFASSGNVAAT